MSESDVTIFNVDASEPGIVDAIVGLTGAESSAQASAVSTPQQANNIEVTLSGAEFSGDAGTLTAFGQGTPGTLGYPRVGQYIIGNIGAWAVEDSLGETMREGMALCDAVFLNMNPALIPDVDQGPGGFLSRQSIVNDLKSRNPDLVIFDYITVQVTGNRVSAGSGGLKCYQGSGPPGAELHWTAKDHGELQNGSSDSGGTDLIFYNAVGDPVNDWWARTSDGTKKATFGTNYSVNICPAFTQPDSNGQRFPQWHFENIGQSLRMDAHAISNGGSGYGEDGINMFFDVMRISPKSSRFDYNGDGTSDSADTFWNAHDDSHRSAAKTQAGGGGVVTANWRLGWRDYFNLYRATYSGIILAANTTSWFPGNIEDEGALGFDVQPEYQLIAGTSYPTLTNDHPRDACIQGGIVENVTSGGSQPSSITGVTSDGTITATVPGGWQRAYNKYRYLVEISQAPKIIFPQYFVDSTFQVGTTANNRKAWSYEPHANTPFHLQRWLDVLALMDNGYCGAAATVIGTGAGTFITAMIFDEYGTINTATTGLSRGWLGQPLEDMVVISGSGDHRLVKREFESGIAIGTTSKTNTIAVAVADIGGSGVFKRITGVQDSSWNDGSTVTADFNMPPRDGIVLQRV